MDGSPLLDGGMSGWSDDRWRCQAPPSLGLVIRAARPLSESGLSLAIVIPFEFHGICFWECFCRPIKSREHMILPASCRHYVRSSSSSRRARSFPVVSIVALMSRPVLSVSWLVEVGDQDKGGEIIKNLGQTRAQLIHGKSLWFGLSTATAAAAADIIFKNFPLHHQNGSGSAALQAIATSDYLFALIDVGDNGTTTKANGKFHVYL